MKDEKKVKSKEFKLRHPSGGWPGGPTLVKGEKWETLREGLRGEGR